MQRPLRDRLERLQDQPAAEPHMRVIHKALERAESKIERRRQGAQ